MIRLKCLIELSFHFVFLATPHGPFRLAAVGSTGLHWLMYPEAESHRASGDVRY